MIICIVLIICCVYIIVIYDSKEYNGKALQ